MPHHGGGQQRKTARATLGPRGRNLVVARADQDEVLNRVRINKFNRGKPYANNQDSASATTTALTAEAYTTKIVT